MPPSKWDDPLVTEAFLKAILTIKDFNGDEQEKIGAEMTANGHPTTWNAIRYAFWSLSIGSGGQVH